MGGLYPVGDAPHLKTGDSRAAVTPIRCQLGNALRWRLSVVCCGQSDVGKIVTRFSEWLRLHEAIAFLAYDCTGDELDAWAYPGASVGLDFFQACDFHPAWRGHIPPPRWLHNALLRSGLLRGSDSPGAPSRSSILHKLKRQIYRREVNREDRDGGSEVVFAELMEWRSKLIAALSSGVFTSYGLSASTGAGSSATLIPAAVYQAPMRLTPEGHIACGLTAGELILWRDVVVRHRDVELNWPAEPEIEPAKEPSAFPSKMGALGTAGAEARLQRWLIERMRSSPDSSPGKESIKEEAKTVGHMASGKAFERAWASAIIAAPAPAWARPGAKSKRAN